jgi:hypothetical protein
MKIKLCLRPGGHGCHRDVQFFIWKDQLLEPHPGKARNLKTTSLFTTLSFHHLTRQGEERNTGQQGAFIEVA